MGLRINRYIVGCKCGLQCSCSGYVRELIDTQWDVNKKASQDTSTAESELIDTQWDVNNLLGKTILFQKTELIDTQWDVNIVIEIPETVDFTN